MTTSTLRIFPGDIFITRNAEGPGEWGNPSPGHWNHAACYTGDNTVVEAQPDMGGVIESDWTEFYQRYPEMVLLRTQPRIRNNVAIGCRQAIGTKYKKRASVFQQLRRRFHNCVSVIRQGFRYATAKDPVWGIPDDLLYDAQNGLNGFTGEVQRLK